jgi:4'-phosphopantetheinyl transferase EntD
VGDGPKGFLSVASRGPWAVAVVANGPIGVDIEDRTSREEIPWELLSEPEVSWLHEQHDRLRWHRFLDLWVAKESAAKAAETARSVAPRDVTICWNGSMDFAGESAFPCEGRLYYEPSSMPQWVVGLASQT